MPNNHFRDVQEVNNEENRMKLRKKLATEKGELHIRNSLQNILFVFFSYLEVELNLFFNFGRTKI